MHGRALEDGHDDLGDAVTGDDGGHYPTGNHEPFVGIEDTPVEQESRKFDGCCRCGVKDFDQDEALRAVHGQMQGDKRHA